MRKLILLLGGIPKSIRRIICKILPVTTKFQTALESGYADDLVKLIPGTTDDTIRTALVLALSEFNDMLRRANGAHETKVIMGAIATSATKWADGRKHDTPEYRAMFERVYQESKTAA